MSRPSLPLTCCDGQRAHTGVPVIGWWPRRGLALPEALTVLMLVSVVAAVSAPALADLQQMRQLKVASGDWARVLVAAREVAFHRQLGARLELQTGSGGCLVLHTGHRGDCRGCGTALRCAPHADLLSASSPLAPGLMAAASNTSLWWNPGERTVTPTATLKIEAADGRAIHHVVNLAGRLRTCSPAGLVGGLPAC